MRTNLIGDADSRRCLFTRTQRTPVSPIEIDQQVHEEAQQQAGGVAHGNGSRQKLENHGSKFTPNA